MPTLPPDVASKAESGTITSLRGLPGTMTKKFTFYLISSGD